jgi:hypothetical protein
MSEENYQILRLKARDPRHPCPTCEMVGGYCGGENHPSCGVFEDGRPAALASRLDIWKAEKKLRV